MKRRTSARLKHRSAAGRSQDPSAGRNAISLTPPDYDIDFVDNRTGMPDGLKAGLEHLSGADLSSVRVHYDSPKPAALQALAYTQGQDIHLAPGQEKHLPHEGWHAVQQGQGRVAPTLQAKGVGINDDGVLEKEADIMGAKAERLGRDGDFACSGSALPQIPAVVQRAKGNAIAGLSEEQWGAVQSGQTISYTPLAAGCLAVTVLFDGGGGAGVHLAMQPNNPNQWNEFREAIAAKRITQVYLDCDLLGYAQGWHVKFSLESLDPETEITPRSAADLLTGMTAQEINEAGWVMDLGSVRQWFSEALGAPVQTSTNTNPAHVIP